MGVSDYITRCAERPAVRKYLEAKSTFGLFIAVVTSIVAIVGFLGKLFDADKTIALLLSRAIGTDPVTKAPELRTWFIPVVLLGIGTIAGLLLLSIWAATRRFARTKDQMALAEFMSSVRQIRDQGKQTKIKAWSSLSFVYLVDKDFSGSLTRVCTLKAVDVPVHFWESTVAVEDEADSAESLSAVNYRVRDLGSPTNKIVYLPSENGQRSKKACLFFLPPILPGEERKFEISYQWPGMFRRLENNSEDIEFTTTTRETLGLYRVEVYLQEGTGRRLDCHITGDQHEGQNLSTAQYELNGWKGFGYIYEVKDVPEGDLRFVLKAALKA